MFTLSCTICECLATGSTLGEAMDNFTLKHSDECVGASSRQEAVIPNTPYTIPCTMPKLEEINIPSVWVNPPDQSKPYVEVTTTWPGSQDMFIYNNDDGEYKIK